MNQINQNLKISTGAKKKANTANEIIRYLAFILRHRPHEAKLKLNEGGWADTNMVVDALAKFKKIKITAQELIDLIGLKSKNSFVINEDGTMIRAKSGHTVLLGFTEAIKVPDILCMYMLKNHITVVFTSGLAMKLGEVLKEIPDGIVPNDMVLVKINTGMAKREKVKFYSKDDAFFAFHIPSKCLRFSSF